MINMSVTLLAKEIQTPVDYLIKKFADAGINKTAVDFVTNKEKEILLAYLNRNRGIKYNKLTLQRKTRTTLNISSAAGKSKSIKIEVRKKHIYMQESFQIKDQDHKLFPQKNNGILTKKIKNDLEDKIQHTKKNKKDNNIVKQTKSIENNKLSNKKNSNTTPSSQKIEKDLREAEAAKIKCQAEKEMHRQVEEKARQAVEDARLMAEEYSKRENNSINSGEEDNIDYHITTSYHAREAEDEHDNKVEHDRRNGTRSSKKNKKSRLYNSKKYREEEARSSYRSKNKCKKNTLTPQFNKKKQILNRNVVIGETITVAELANKMSVKGSQVIKIMMKLGAMVTINQIIDQETAHLVAEEMGHKVILHRENKLEELVMSYREKGQRIAKSRAPVVTIMGHVDHGKTSLLDYIRSTKVASSEAGGITQHIGAYHVKTDNGMITFLDTPGHAAFTAMRARGAHTTDIVVIVIAADDGIMPQTIEAIQHAKAAKVPIIIAINKIDKNEADPDRVKNELTKHGILPEEWGGDNQCIHVSAQSGIGINELLEAILLQAEMLELKAIHDGMSSGVVIESFLDKGRGPVATVLVQEGTLNQGDVVLCGFEYGRVRAMRNERGDNVTSAGPSIPVEIIGLSGVPVSGDKISVVLDEKKAREVALYRQGKFREKKLARQQKSKLENVFVNIKETNISELNIVLKSDVQGTVEAIIDTLENLSTNEVKIKIIGSGVGGITETDAMLAAASKAILLGFNVRADYSARKVIESENVDVRYYSVIYNLIDEVKKTMSGMLIPAYKKEIVGLAEVRHIFRSQKCHVIAGCLVKEGIVKHHNKIRILRENISVYEGELESLRRFKEDVKEVRNGMECGMVIKNYNDIRLGDMIEVFETVQIQRPFE